MRVIQRHCDLDYGQKKSTCDGIIRRLYARDYGTRDKNNKKIKQAWSRTKYVYCEKCEMVFEKEQSGGIKCKKL